MITSRPAGSRSNVVARPRHGAGVTLALALAVGVAVWIGAARPLAAAAAAARSAPRAHAAVVVVGAGLTGLTTAFELRKAGIDVVLLEAAARAGGRIQTVAFEDGAHVEAHMEEFWARSPAYALLRELRLPLVADVAHSSVRLAGAVYPYRGSGDRETYLGGIFTDAERAALRRWNDQVWGLYQRLHQQQLVEHRPLDDDLAALEKVSFAAFVQQAGLPPKVSEWIRVTLEPEIAVEWDAISALDGIDEMRLFLDTPQGFGETNYHVSGGNGRFIDALADRVGRARIVLRAEVTAVERTDDGVRVRYLHEGARFRTIDARAAVVTVPLPALRRIQFVPPLGDEKRQAIETTGFGPYIKVHVRVAPEAARAWTPDGKTVLTLLSDSPAGSIYDAGGFQRQGPLADRCLTLLIHARFARQMLGMNADDMRAHALRSLDAIFPGTAAHVRRVELFVYPEAVAYWPLARGRSRFDALAAALRRPEGGTIWIGGDTTEGSHSEGAVQAALRMAGELVALKGVLMKPAPRAPAVVRRAE
jgi:monoamine oxidase